MTMKSILKEVLEKSGALTVEQIFFHIIAAAMLATIIYLSYCYTHSGTSYSKKFNVSLVTLTILTATVMTVIGNNVALSLGMVGALSIVRFRTAIKDSRDTTYIFWAIVVGICCGVGDYTVASIGSAMIFITLFFFGRVKNENRILLIVKGSLFLESELENLIFTHFEGKALQRVKNTTPTSVEMIFELSKKNFEKKYQKEKTITSKIYALGNIDYLNVVVQSDEING